MTNLLKLEIKISGNGIVLRKGQTELLPEFCTIQVPISPVSFKNDSMSRQKISQLTGQSLCSQS